LHTTHHGCINISSNFTNNNTFHIPPNTSDNVPSFDTVLSEEYSKEYSNIRNAVKENIISKLHYLVHRPRYRDQIICMVNEL
jgi:hypothetical protein